MTSGLAVSDVVNVTVSIQPIAAAVRNFGALMIIGPTDLINTTERVRSYSNIAGVLADFGNSVPEYLAANLFFSQSPQPSILYIGRWAKTATHGTLNGGIFSSAAQATLLSALQAISTGSFAITIDSVSHNISALNLTGISNLNGAATIIQAALISAGFSSATCTWAADSNSRFVIKSGSTGTSSTVSYATTTGGGVDISASLQLTAATGASVPVAGIAAETPVAAMTALLAPGLINQDVYGTMFAPTVYTDITDLQHQAVSALIESYSPSHIYGITSQSATLIDPTQTTDLASVSKGLNFSRTFITYSSSTAYAAASIFGRAFTVNFTANNTVITLKFKQEPGITAENLTETQATALNTKNCNVFVQYNNSTAIIQQGVMCNGYFFDEIHGTDWLQNTVQTNVYNILYTSPTKIPQTDAGVGLLVAAVEQGCEAGVFNGLISPGTWTSTLQFGQLKTGQALARGYYVYAPPISTQSDAARAARQSPTIQAAIKLAGAVHFAGVAINVNR